MFPDFDGITGHPLGRLHKVKNHAMLIDSFAAFSGQYPDYELHFYGQGDLEGELKQRAENLKISDKVVWHGFCGNVTKEVQDAGMFVLSSNYEGISNSRNCPAMLSTE